MKVVTKNIGKTFSVAVIPVLKDNYTYVIHDKNTDTIAAVDVSADVAPVIDYVRRIGHETKFRTIISTHKHWDHAGGNLTLPKKINAAGEFTVIGGASDNIPGATRTVRDGDVLPLGALRVEVLDAPCHTRGHVLYRVYNPQAAKDGEALFTGDTMFVGGIGAFFEGSAAQMCAALQKVYGMHGEDRDADQRTFVFPGHEYTVNFIKFTRSMLPKTHPDAAFVAAQLERYEKNLAQHTPTVPSTLEEEKRQNLFLRTCDDAFVREMKHGDTAEELMQHLYDTCP